MQARGGGGRGGAGEGTMVQMSCSLAPKNLCLFRVCRTGHIYSFALELHSLHREVHSENVFYAYICIKMYRLCHRFVLMLRFGASVDVNITAVSFTRQEVCGLKKVLASFLLLVTTF